MIGMQLCLIAFVCTLNLFLAKSHNRPLFSVLRSPIDKTLAKLRGGSTKNSITASRGVPATKDALTTTPADATVSAEPEEDESFMFDILNPSVHASASNVNRARETSRSLLESQHQYIPMVRIDRQGQVSQIVKTKYDILQEFVLSSWKDIEFLDPLYRGPAIAHLLQRQRGCFLAIQQVKLIIDYQYQEVLICQLDHEDALVDQIIKVVRDAFINHPLEEENRWALLPLPSSSETLSGTERATAAVSHAAMKLRRLGMNTLKRLTATTSATLMKYNVKGINFEDINNETVSAQSFNEEEVRDSLWHSIEMNRLILPRIMEVIQTSLFQTVVNVRPIVKQSQANIQQLELKRPIPTMKESSSKSKSNNYNLLYLKQFQRSSILPLQEELLQIKSRINETKHFIQNVLNIIYSLTKARNYRIGAILMNLANGQIGNTQHIPEWTASLDTTLTELGWIMLEVDELLKQVENQHQSLGVIIETQEYAAAKFGHFITIGSLAIAVGALITGLFGMNLLSQFETHEAAFYIVALFIAFGMNTTFKKLLSIAENEHLM